MTNQLLRPPHYIPRYIRSKGTHPGRRNQEHTPQQGTIGHATKSPEGRLQKPSRTCGTQETNEAFTSTRVKTKGTWQRVPPVRQSSIGHVTKSLKGRSQRPSHTDQHMPKQAHHRCSTGHAIGNDGSAPCAPILPWHPETNLQRTSGAQPTHRLQHLTDGQCIWLWRRKSDSSPCPLRVLQGSSVRHSTTNPKQLTTAAHSATINYNDYAHPKLVLPRQHSAPTRRET